MPLRRCLVIDDDPIAAIFLVELLRARGLEVDHAHNLAQAQQRLHESNYDFLLADRRLPDGDGVDWLRRRLSAPAWPASMRCTPRRITTIRKSPCVRGTWSAA